MTNITDKNGRQLSSSEVFIKIFNRLKSYLTDFWLMILNFIAIVPSHSVRNFFYRISGLTLGRKSYIHYGARFYELGNISIGQGTIIGDHAFIDGRDKVKIGNNVDIASEIRIYNSEHDINDENFTATVSPVTIEDFVFIGPRVTILPGVTIHKGAVIAAGSVVVKDVEESTLVGGVPAKFIKTREISDYHYKLGRPRLFQ